jgi:hypothetical protein
MFARVITAQAGAEGFDNLISLAEQQLPAARQRPGFQGFYLVVRCHCTTRMTTTMTSSSANPAPAHGQGWRQNSGLARSRV